MEQAENEVYVLWADVNQTDTWYSICACLLQTPDICIKLTGDLLLTNPPHCYICTSWMFTFPSLTFRPLPCANEWRVGLVNFILLLFTVRLPIFSLASFGIILFLFVLLLFMHLFLVQVSRISLSKTTKFEFSKILLNDCHGPDVDTEDLFIPLVTVKSFWLWLM